MSEEMYGPEERGLWISVSTEINGRPGHGMTVPERLLDGVLESVRTAATARASYALGAALVKWDALSTDIPNLIERSSLEGVQQMLENALESVRVLVELAPELYDDEDEGQGEPEPDPSPAEARNV